MKSNQILIAIAFVCIIVAGVMYLFAYSRAPYAHLNTNLASSTASTSVSAKIAAAGIEDGTYTVHIHSILSTAEDTRITFSHVTYFEGAEASSSASHDVPCPNKPLEACVPTLTRNFYVRQSGTPDFTVPVPSQASIVLHDVPHGTVKSLRDIVREFQPVFEVVVINGNVVSITEKSPA
jgi:hypothetical protein